jgi:signal transduction histidine kinase/CheY-like chemotaxis protein/HPt (histidine-containing phosphotransfer) domain-containing protein
MNSLWLTVTSIVTVVVFMALAMLGVQGPWMYLSMAAAIVAACGSILAIGASRTSSKSLQEAEQQITDARSQNTELQRDLVHLEQLEQQLIHAKRAAEAAAISKGEFMATMSHEIRTPLNGIIPMLDLITDSDLSPDQREMLHTARESSQQLLRIVDDILDYSKLDAHRVELENTTFNMGELLNSLTQLIRRSAENKGLRLQLEMDPAIRLSVRGDPIRLRQVLSNLLSNAIKFTERGGILVKVQRLGETTTQHSIRFEVHDTGIGISQEQQSKLFHSFTQADASTTRLYGGTGLGLAICKRIIDLLGGQIGVQSELGRGSTFWFEIPLLKAIGDIERAPTPMRNGRALVITPDTALRQQLTSMLGSWNLQVFTLDNTHEALIRLRQVVDSPYEFVLADYDNLRHSAPALYLFLTRQPYDSATSLIWIQGNRPVPDELRERAALLLQNVSEEDARAVIFSSPVVRRTDDTQQRPPVPQPEAQQEANAPPGLPTKPIRLLLAEDNPVNKLVAEKILATCHIDYDVALNGEIALSLMKSNRYDMVLMDCQMPVMDGYIATRAWREIESHRSSQTRLLIVAITANAMADDRKRCLDAGMDDYLSKPLMRDQLLTCLRRWLPQHFTATGETGESVVPAIPPTTLEGAPDIQTNETVQTTLSSSVLDVNILNELKAVTGDDITAIVALFLESAPQSIHQLKIASTPGQQNLEDIRNAAHSLKSSSANVGALRLSAAARRMEIDARMNTLERPAQAIAGIIIEYSKANAALRDYLAAQGKAPSEPSQTISQSPDY